MARSSTRSIRNRQSGDAAQLREMKARALALSSPTNKTEFRRGFDQVCTDVKNGASPAMAFDLATSPGHVEAYSRGANAALALLEGNEAYAAKLAQAYGVSLDG